jgi:YD repeat-containing protein
MTDVETVLRTQLHDRLDDVGSSTWTAQRALRAGQRVRRRRIALVACSAAVVLGAAGLTVALVVDRTAPTTDEAVTTPASGLTSRTVDYAEQFRADDFTTIRSEMTPRTRATLTEATLRSGWEQIVAAYGRSTGVGEPSVSTAGNTTVLVPLRFARGAVDMRVTYDGSGRVIGVTLLNAGLEELPPQAAAFETEAREVVALLNNGRFADVHARFDETMSKGLPVDALRQAWQDVAIDRHGGFVAAGGVTARQISGNTVIEVFCAMRKGELKVRVSFDQARQIIGLYFLEP